MYTYVESVSSNLACCICRMPFTDPYTTRTCQHTFCKDCITHSLNYHSNQCPIDRLPLTISDLVAANPIIRSLVDELVVECPHKEEGCAVTVQRQLMAAHLLSNCPYRQGYTLPEVGERSEQGTTDSDPEHKEDGSGSQSSRGTQTEPEVVLSDKRFAALSEQNILLRQRAELLESTVSVMKREMATVRRALGPWFRAAERTGMGHSEPLRPLHASPESPSTSLAISPHGGSNNSAPERAAVEEIEASLWNPLASPSAVPGRSDEEVSVFPDIQYQQPYGFVPRPQPDMLQHQRRYSFGASRTDPRSPKTDGMVAPLNLNTSLEGALAGLRESLVGLATTVDSMGRSHEMSLAHEGMRVSEEVGGLRAAIHGLRMQVHSIMMDRNAQVTGRPPVFNGLFANNGPLEDGLGGPARPINQVKL